MEKTIVIPIKVGSTERKYTVQYPNVGQFIKIQVRQSQLATSYDGVNQYFNLVRQNTNSAFDALGLIDMIAHFEVLVPSLVKEQNLENLTSIEDLDMMDAKPLLDAYNKILYPWLKKWKDIFRGTVEENKKEENEKS